MTILSQDNIKQVMFMLASIGFTVTPINTGVMCIENSNVFTIAFGEKIEVTE